MYKNNYYTKGVLLFFLIHNWFSVLGNTYFVEDNFALANAINLVVAGDSIVMKNGIWSDIHINFEASGTSQNPIVLKAEGIGQVFIEGYSKLNIAGEYLVVEGLFFRNGFIHESDKSVVGFRAESGEVSNYCRLSNCFIKSYNTQDLSIEYKYIGVHGTNNRIDHCHFEGKSNIGALLVVWTDEFSDNHLIDSNYFGPRPFLGEKDSEIIRLGNSTYAIYESNTIVENNLFYQCDGEGEIISNKSSANIFRYNTFRDCKGMLTLRHGNRSHVYNNFFIGNYMTEKQGGVRVTGEGHLIYNNYFQDLKNGSSKISGAIVLMDGTHNAQVSGYAPVKNILISNNTTVNCEIGLMIGGGLAVQPIVAPDSCTIVNNIFYSTRGDRSLFWFQNTPTNMIFSSNIVYGDDLGINEIAGINRIDPKISQSNNDIWRITNSSPAIDSSNMNYIDNLFSNDMDGQERTPNKFDIGSDEFSTNPITRKPLFKEDIGPLTAINPVINSNSFSFYPSPARNILNLKGEIRDVKIISLKGQLIYHKRIDNGQKSISISQIDSGIYLILFNNQFSEKLVIVR